MKANWIAADWGTSNLRVWAMSEAAEILGRAESADGMANLAPDDFEPALLSLIEPWLSDITNVVACGMVGARQGWVEADYLSVPCAPTTSNLTQAPTNDPRLRVFIAPGLSQLNQPDVMRGEETQIAGFLSTEPDFDGVICLPGTHTKWVRVSAGEIVSFQTYMSGEIFALLASQSVLKHSVTTDNFDEYVFKDALSETLSKPATTAAKLFSLRAASLLTEQTETHARSRLSGLLLGLELGGARPYWLGQDIVILGSKELASLYASALSAQGALSRIVPAETLTLLGLTQAYAHIGDRK